MAMFSFFRAWCPVVLATGRLHRLCSIYTPAEGTSPAAVGITRGGRSFPLAPAVAILVVRIGAATGAAIAGRSIRTVVRWQGNCVTKAVHAASDHAAIWVDLNI
jgi:hypothetical protein